MIWQPRVFSGDYALLLLAKYSGEGGGGGGLHRSGRSGKHTEQIYWE